MMNYRQGLRVAPALLGVMLAAVVAAPAAAGPPPSLADSSNVGALAWGDNIDGKLGDGTFLRRRLPTVVHDLFQDVRQLTGGYDHSLALKSDGSVWAWGENAHGQVGVGTNVSSYTKPQRVVGLGGVVQITAGNGHHSMALREDGTVWAWGDNTLGQLGDGTTATRRQPVQVVSLTGVTAIAAGFEHSLALRADGTVWAWGAGTRGQLGPQGGGFSTLPREVSGLAGAVRIAAGFRHNLVLLGDGTIRAWGDNQYGQLGSGSTEPWTSELVQPPVGAGVRGVSLIGAGSFHSMACTGDIQAGTCTNTTFWAWGRNTDFQLGDGTNVERRTPRQIPSVPDVLQIDGGAAHSMLLVVRPQDGYTDVWTTGSNVYGQQGDGALDPHLVYGPAVNMVAATYIDAGQRHSLAARPDVFCCGVTAHA